MNEFDVLERKNFKAIDFFKSNIAKKYKINNFVKSQTIIDNLSVLADKIQEVRNLLNCPIIIFSAYRCPELNEMVKGKKYSQHLYGQAIDFCAPEFGTPHEIVLFLKENKVVVDQCLIEDGWVHLSIRKNMNRNQFAQLSKDKFEVV